MKRQEREESNHDRLMIGAIIVLTITFVVVFLVAISVVRAPVQVPPEITRNAVPRPLQTVTSPLPTIEAPSSTPEPREAKICVTATGIPSYWKVSTVIREWNLADKYVDFVLSNRCTGIESPKVAITLGYLPSDTVAETRFGSYCCSISLVLNRTIKSPWVAQSTMCHEFGHVLGLPHISGTVDTCMTAKDSFYRTRPTGIDSRLVNSYGKWEFWKMYDLSGKDVDIRSMPR